MKREVVRKYIAELDFSHVIDQYNIRASMSERLKRLLLEGKVDAYAQLALGIDDIHGNYSARDHHLGPKILAARPAKSVHSLGLQLIETDLDKAVQLAIHGANIPYLKISVGTEMAMLLKPNDHWVANTRSIWAYLLLKHGSMSLAREELALYRTGAQESEMAYRLWSDIHSRMAPSTVVLAELAGCGNTQRAQPCC